MKKILKITGIVLVLVVFAVVGYYGTRIVNKYTPSKEWADLKTVFSADGDSVTLVLDQDVQEITGYYRQGQSYIPLEWVNSYLNERFYWDGVEKKLVYALPEEILFFDNTSVGENGAPVFLEEAEGIYLEAGLVLKYTDIRTESFVEGEAKRIYIDTNWDAQEKAVIAAKKAKIRRKGGIKSPILTELAEGTAVTILFEDENWSEVRTPDGFMGYVENKKLEGAYEEKLESSFVKPVYKNIALEEKICLVWHQVGGIGTEEAMEKMIANTSGVNVISPTWFSLTDNQGNFKSLASQSYVDKAHAKGIAVWALLDNFSKEVNTEILMTPSSNRRRLIDGLIKEVKAYDIDGINLDFEGIKEEAGVHYVQFIRELSVACRAESIVLSVDNYVPAGYNRFYNRKEQGVVVDYVIIMGYDEHYSGGEKGSVASISYVENGIAETLEDVPKEKVINAIPFYTRVWKEDNDGKSSSSALSISNAKEWVERNKVELYWQEELGQFYGERETKSGKEYIWLEEEKSIQLKVDLIHKYELAGIACWKLGFDPKGIWKIVKP